MRRAVLAAAGALVVVLAVSLARLGIHDWRSPATGSYAGDRRAVLALEVSRSQLAAGELASARASAARALSLSPASALPMRGLAEVADAAGQGEQALALFIQSAVRSRRDARTHSWLAEHHARTGEVARALDHVDLLLRAHPGLGEAAFPGLLGLLRFPGGGDLLAERLAQAPSWRLPLLRFLAREADETDLPALVAVFSALARTAEPARASELAPVLNRLIAEGRHGQAWLMFVSTLEPARLSALGNIFNGDFAHDPSGLPFDWIFGRVAGASISVVTAPERDADSARALRIEFANRRVPFRHVSQTLLLEPGSYRLQGRVRTQSLRNERGLQWVLQCTTGARARLAQTPPVSGTQAWSRFVTGFEVPAVDCPVQTLRLELPARVASEQQISGQAWFTDLSVTRSTGVD